ncbi:hypothetical protein RhiirA4_488771 [Rhizophagus irregularis]|uniref:Uncharacterized protein n=1 Tax=Rhizophagus irregularis TaxID=588596 RepID=A0A2I1HU39_9GLOM|nr:hypothetical protein RhiirA4_488771 [Rhizophagus irregularis]
MTCFRDVRASSTSADMNGISQWFAISSLRVEVPAFPVTHFGGSAFPVAHFGGSRLSGHPFRRFPTFPFQR